MTRSDEVVREFVESLSLEIFKDHQHTVLGNLLEQQGWIRWTQKSLTTQTILQF